MTPKQLRLHVLLLATLLSLLTFSDVSSESKLLKILAKREASEEPEPMAVAVSPHDAAGFLVKRPRRNVWDRSRPDVQQWIMQLMHMGYDEARLETDLSYWMDYSRAHDQGRQHHYDENAPIGPRDSASFRHGANVNYDYY
ncbi:augurin-A-like [Brienomyrus brachyistius]|uniref:augurin-A-like n=1 Tax=Brienomyrus brachyistius TaxID=42636 RepID=UPI0020B3DA42|nr:augurin-A-like [Brienomyrus brachyistius]